MHCGRWYGVPPKRIVMFGKVNQGGQLIHIVDTKTGEGNDSDTYVLNRNIDSKYRYTKDSKVLKENKDDYDNATFFALLFDESRSMWLRLDQSSIRWAVNPQHLFPNNWQLLGKGTWGEKSYM